MTDRFHPDRQNPHSPDALPRFCDDQGQPLDVDPWLYQPFKGWRGAHPYGPRIGPDMMYEGGFKPPWAK